MYADKNYNNPFNYNLYGFVLFPYFSHREVKVILKAMVWLLIVI